MNLKTKIMKKNYSQCVLHCLLEFGYTDNQL